MNSVAIDPNDATSVPVEIRDAALKAALIAFDRALDERGVVLDLFARFELLDLALNATYQRLNPPSTRN